MFQPPRCPYPECPRFARPEPGFYQRSGSYRAKCRPHPIPRFLCKTCGRTFSRQTFRMDRHDHRPDLNAKLFQLLASGVGLRQSARMLGLSRRCVELKARKIGRHLRQIDLNLCGLLPEGCELAFDELETYEGRRRTRPLTVPLLVETTSHFILWAESAPIRPSGKMSEARLAAIAEDEARYGPRRNLSRSAILRTLRRGAARTSHLERVVLITDEKTLYPALASEVFGAARLEHRTVNSEVARSTWNPLFPVNHTEAVMRDLMGRLRRDSWLVSKRRRYLDVALHVFIAFRNWVRSRFNGEDFSAGQMLGFVPRRLTIGELLSWRQDCGALSPWPLSRKARSIADHRAAQEVAS